MTIVPVGAVETSDMTIVPVGAVETSDMTPDSITSSAAGG